MTIQFTTNFGPFVCEGDTIEVENGALRFVATLYYDDDTTPPDERQDGYWPSLDPNSDGYIGPRSKATLARHMARAQHVLDEWKADNWHYFGVAVQAFIGETELTGKYGHACWGIEGNWPARSKAHYAKRNHYFGDVANDLIRECEIEAIEKLGDVAAAYEEMTGSLNT